MTSYEELAKLVNAMPRIPKHEMKCHPLVMMLLREESWWSPHSRSDLWNYYDLLSCPVFIDQTMEPGAWEIYEDNVLIKFGNTERRCDS